MKRVSDSQTLVAVVTTLGLVVCAASSAQANSCGAPPDAVEAADQADAVFVGEIVGDGNERHPFSCAEGWLRAHLGLDRPSQACETGYITFSVLEQFKGGLGSKVTLVLDDPIDPEHRLAVGTQLLVYAPRDRRGNLSLQACGRNLFLPLAADDLTVLRMSYPHEH